MDQELLTMLANYPVLVINCKTDEHMLARPSYKVAFSWL